MNAIMSYFDKKENTLCFINLASKSDHPETTIQGGVSRCTQLQIQPLENNQCKCLLSPYLSPSNQLLHVTKSFIFTAITQLSPCNNGSGIEGRFTINMVLCYTAT